MQRHWQLELEPIDARKTQKLNLIEDRIYRYLVRSRGEFMFDIKINTYTIRILEFSI